MEAGRLVRSYQASPGEIIMVSRGEAEFVYMVKAERQDSHRVDVGRPHSTDPRLWA